MRDVPHLSALTQVLSEHEPELAAAPARVFDLAAVAVVCAGPPDDLRVCFIRRAARAGDPWSGQMAFPGGRQDPSDATVQAVAEREAFEEVGLRLEQATLLGRLDDATMRRKNGGVLASFVYDAGRAFPSLTPDPAEVAATFWIPLAHLWDPANRTTVDWTHEGQAMQFPGIAHGDDVVWGLSLRVLGRLGELLKMPLPDALAPFRR
ncbi:MAG: CoA pyrophosphatase [Myxococcota bacterium]